MKKSVSLAVAVASFLSLNHQSFGALAAVGDIAFTGYSAGNLSLGAIDSLAFVPLTSVALGDVIFFTDDELPTLVDGEGALRWEATATVPAGTVIQIQFNGTTNIGSANAGTVTEPDAGFGLSSGGDLHLVLGRHHHKIHPMW